MPPMSFAGDANFPRTPLGLCSPGSNASFFGCTTKQHNAHGTEVREVLYPWHPWFGREVHVHEVVKRGNMPVFWCSPTANRTGRCLAVPSWMFDRVACLHLHPAQTPQVDLDNLKTLLSDIIGRVPSAGSVIGARHPSHQSRGDADATRQPAAPNQTTQPVPAVLPRTRSDQPAQAGARHGGASDGADALDGDGGQRGGQGNGRTN
jgi:hypothetical protein